MSGLSGAEEQSDESSPDINWSAFEYYASLKKLSLYLEKHPNVELNLRSAAGIAAMEATNFSKFFAKKTGIPFKYWNDLRRIERAKRALGLSDISIADAAFKFGFQDVGTFTRTFKRITKMTPSAYRKRFGCGKQ